MIHGPGGQGKTRLASRFAELSTEKGWLVHQARHATDLGPAISQESNSEVAKGVLLVVDYAERWPSGDLQRLFQDHRLRLGVKRPGI